VKSNFGGKNVLFLPLYQLKNSLCARYDMCLDCECEDWLIKVVRDVTKVPLSLQEMFLEIRKSSCRFVVI
jgi:hypothetical protein